MADGPPKEEKTEDATAKRKSEARDKGQVAFSSEFVSSCMLAAMVATFALLGGRLATAGGELIKQATEVMPAIGALDLDVNTATGLLRSAIESVLPRFLLLLAPVFLVGVLTGFFQVGVHFAAKAVEPQPNKLNPISGFSKIFSMRGIVRTGMGGAKILLTATVAFTVALWLAPDSGNVAGTDARTFLPVVGYVLLRATGAAILVLFVLSLVDLIYQRWQHAQDLKMTKKEVKDENKNTEGDPLVKSRIRTVQRELASRRMMQDVPDATVVVTNPTHVAVALRYDETRDGTPVVVAKGLDDVAQNIKAVAAEAGVMLHEEPPLARALHRMCEVGDPVPAELFEAVARVLAYVYRVEGRAPVGA